MKFLSTSFAQLPFSLYKRDRETYKKNLNSGEQNFHCPLKFCKWNSIANVPLFPQKFLRKEGPSQMGDGEMVKRQLQR